MGGSGVARGKKRTLVLSDVHLSQAHPDDPVDPLWMRYRRADHHPDAEFAGLVDHLLEENRRGEGAPIEVVFNGDIFDFDAPWVKNGESSFDEFPPTGDGCAAQVRLILADHQVFFGAVARLLAADERHRVTFLSGNHDLELWFSEVREAIAEEIVRLAAIASVDDRIRFRAWFHLTEDRLYFEHGSQYDIHNGVRHAAIPLTREGDRLHPVLGKLAFRRTGSRMGYFNPYYEETFYMGLFGYLGHFAKAYAFSHRHIVRTWLFGSLSTVAEIWRHRHFDERIEEGRAAVRKEVGNHLTDEAIDATHALRAKPAEDTMIPVLRELWLDRVALAGFGLVIALGLLPLAGWLVALGFAAIYVVGFVLYEVLTPKPDIRTYDSAPASVLRLFDIHGVRAICMGHTHRPFARFTDKGLYGNSGSWCPAFHDALCTKPVLEARPVLWITTTETELHGGLYWWRAGRLEASAETRPPPVDTAAEAGPEETKLAGSW